MAIGHRRASGQMRIAVTLRDRLPHVAALFLNGALSLRIVSTITWRTQLVEDPEGLAMIDAAIAERATNWGRLSDHKLDQAIDAWIDQYDPDALRCTEAAARTRDFTIGDIDDPAGVVSVWGRLRAHPRRSAPPPGHRHGPRCLRRRSPHHERAPRRRRGAHWPTAPTTSSAPADPIPARPLANQQFHQRHHPGLGRTGRRRRGDCARDPRCDASARDPRRDADQAIGRADPGRRRSSDTSAEGSDPRRRQSPAHHAARRRTRIALPAVSRSWPSSSGCETCSAASSAAMSPPTAATSTTPSPIPTARRTPRTSNVCVALHHLGKTFDGWHDVQLPRRHRHLDLAQRPHLYHQTRKPTVLPDVEYHHRRYPPTTDPDTARPPIGD